VEVMVADMNCNQFILATLLNSGGIFESVTKLQKIAFLSIYENGLETFTEFTWHRYGPFSRELQDSVETLDKEGLVIEEELNRISYSGNEYTVKRLSLTQKGRQMAVSVFADMDIPNKTSLLETIDKYGNKSLGKIIQYVYTAYSPEDF